MACEWVISFFNERNAHSPECIYISCRSAKKRRLLNEGELEARLANRGFQIVRTEQLSVAKQSVLFRRARCVVAPFQKPFRLVEIFPAGHEFHLPVIEMGVGLEAFLERSPVCAPHNGVLIMRYRPLHRLPQKRGVKGIGYLELQGVHQVVAGDCAQFREHLFSEFQIRLTEQIAAGLVGVAARRAKVLF